MKKRLTSWLLVLTMIVSLIPSTLITASAADVTGITNELTFDETGVANITRDSSYILTGDQNGKIVKISDGTTATLLLRNVTMESATSPIQLGENATLTLIVADDSVNTIKCNATEVTTDGESANNGMTAGIHVPASATLIIDTPEGQVGGDKANGQLAVTGGYGGAGIGGKAAVGYDADNKAATSAAGVQGGASSMNFGRYHIGPTPAAQGVEGGRAGNNAEAAGTITIKSSVLTAAGGYGAAGIGGGMGATGEAGQAGNIGGKSATQGLSGGVGHNGGPAVYGCSGGGSGSAGGTGGTGGAGGAGGNVTISGGTITATGANGAAGIGGGIGGFGGAGGVGGQGADGSPTYDDRTYGGYEGLGRQGGGGMGGTGGFGGIGGVGGSGGSLTISGGTVNATGTEVGIGGGQGGVGGQGGTGGTGGWGTIGENVGEGKRIGGKEIVDKLNNGEKEIVAESAGGRPGWGGTGGNGGASAALRISGGSIMANGNTNRVGGNIGGATGQKGDWGTAGKGPNGEGIQYWKDGYTNVVAYYYGTIEVWAGGWGAMTTAVDEPDRTTKSGAAAGITIDGTHRDTNETNIWTNFTKQGDDGNWKLDAFSRPKDILGNDLYLYTVKVTAFDGMTAVEGATVTLHHVQGGTGNEYTYSGVSNKDGYVQLWLPLTGDSSTYTLKDTDVYSETAGWLHRLRPLDIVMTKRDNGEGIARITPNFTLAETPEAQVYFKQDSDNPATIKLDASKIPYTISAIKWFVEPILSDAQGNLNTNNYDSVLNRLENVQLFSQGYNNAKAKGNGKSEDKEAKSLELPINQNGRYWFEVEYSTDQGGKSAVVNGIQIDNIYREYPVQVRQYIADGTDKNNQPIISSDTGYQPLPSANGQAQSIHYGFAWDLNGYNATGDQDPTKLLPIKLAPSDKITLYPRTNYFTWYKALLQGANTNFKGNHEGESVDGNDVTSTDYMPVELTLNKKFLTLTTDGNGECDEVENKKDPSKYTIIYSPREGVLDPVYIYGQVEGTDQELYQHVRTYLMSIHSDTIRAIDYPNYKLTGVKILYGDGKEETGTLNRDDDGNQLDSVSITDLHGFESQRKIKAVTFLYEYNMTDVTIKALYKGTTTSVEEFTVYKTPMEIGTKVAYNAPVIDGFTMESNTLDADGTYTVDKDGEIIFYYTKNTGNVTYRAVDQEDNTTVIWTKDSTVEKGDAPDTSILPNNKDDAAFLAKYERVGTTATITDSQGREATTYDGIHDLTVTYTYQRKTRDITIKQIDSATGNVIGTPTTLAGQKVGESVDVTAPSAPEGYTLTSKGTQRIYVDPDTGVDLTVEFYYKQSDNATITIKLYASEEDKTNNKPFNTMTLSSVYGEQQTVDAPKVTGWKLKTGERAQVTLTPKKGDADSCVAKFVYDAVYDNITVELSGVDTADLPNDWSTGSKTFRVQQGQGFTITAPSIVNYKLADGETLEKGFTAAEITAGKDGKKITFNYVKAEADLITITVKGVKDGETDPLYTYTKDVKKSADAVEVQIFNLAGYKLDNVKMGQTEVTAQNGAYKINPNGNPQTTVTATYSSNMADVTINGYLKGTTTSLFNSFTVKAEAGKAFTYAQPSLIGYDTVTPINNTIDAVKTGDSITFYYQKSEGNVTYKAQDENGKELAVKTVKVEKDGAIVKTTAKANELFTIPYYQVKGEGVVTTNAADNTQYDGVNDVTVTYTYEKIKKAVTIEKIDQATGKKIEGVAAQVTEALATGETHTVTLTNVDGYTSLDSGSVNIFVKNEDDQVVKVYYKQSAEAFITVKQVCGSVILNTYQIPAQYGVETTIKAPMMQGYNAPVDTKFTAEKNKTNEVTLTYTLDAWTVTVKLVDQTNHEINVPSFQKTYQVKKGDSFSIAAPSINDYSLVSTDLVVTRAATELENEANRTITFKYDKTENVDYVIHTIRGVDKDNGSAQLFNYTVLVAKDATDENAVATYYAPAWANLTPATLVQTAKKNETKTVTFEYSSNLATVTVEHVGRDGQKLTEGGITDVELDGYTVTGKATTIAAPALDNYVCVGAYTTSVQEGKLTQDVTLAAGSNTVKFVYEKIADSDVVFKLVDKDTNHIINYIKGAIGTTYAPAQTNNALNLSSINYKFVADANASSPFKPNEAASLAVADGMKGEYVVYYVREKRNVTYKFMDVTGGEAAASEIQDVTNGNETSARIGEKFKATAPVIDGYTVVGNASFDEVVAAGTDALTITFNYKQKDTAEVTVSHKVNDTNGDVLFSYTMSASVGEWVSAESRDFGGKYTLKSGASQKIQVKNGVNFIEFYYVPNFVTATIYTNTDGTDLGNTYYTIATGAKKDKETIELTPPSKNGMVLVGIKVDQDGGKDQFANGWNKLTNTLTLNLSADSADTITVVYYYKAIEDVIPIYQAKVTVHAMYNDHQIGKVNRTETVTKNKESKIIPSSYDGYVVKEYKLGEYGQKTALTEDQKVNGVAVTAAENMDVYFYYERTDHVVVVPGKDNVIGGGDDIIVKPGKDNPEETPKTDDKGNVKVPDGGTVTLPDGTEVTPPGGSFVKPDGTIVLPGTGGSTEPGDGATEIDPTKPGELPTGWLMVKYDLMGGKGTIPAQIIKQGESVRALNPADYSVTAPANSTFKAWNDDVKGYGTEYAADRTIHADAVTNAEKTLTLYAQWSNKSAAESKYHAVVHFDSNNVTGQKMDDQVLVSDTSKIIREKLNENTMTLAGWTFGGWNEKNDGTGKQYANGSVIIVEGSENKDQPTEIPLFAQWYKVNTDGSITVPGKDNTPNTKNDVTANGNGTDQPKRNDDGTITIPAGGSIIKKDPNSGEDVTIDLPNGGTLKPDGSISINQPSKPDGSDGGTIDIDKDGNGTTKDNQGQTKAMVTVTYNINNGEDNSKQVYVVKGEKFNAANTDLFQWSGHKFIGWMHTKNTDPVVVETYAAGQEITAENHMTLFAQWVDISNKDKDGTIVLPGTDGSTGGDKDDNVSVKPAPGGSLEGPYDNGNVKVPDNSTGTVVRPNPDGNGKEEIEVPGGTTVKPDGSIVLPGNGGTIKPGDKIDMDTNLNGYSVVIFEKGEGTGDTVKKIVKNGNINLPAQNLFAAPANKTFSGWKTGEEIKGAGAEYTVTKNVTFTAQFKKIQTGKAVVTFDFDGGTAGGKTYETRTGDPGATLGTLPNPTRGGYTFAGWNEQITENTLFGEENSTTTYTAQWTAKTYTIHYNGNGATGNVADQTYVFNTANAKLAQNSFTLADKVFLGWSVNKDATSAMFREGEEIGDALRAILTNLDKNSESELTLYAIWKDNQVTPSEAIAIFDFAGGKDANGNTSIRKTGAADAAITITAPTREGYTFTGWDKGEPKFGATGTVTVFTAQWTATQYTVTFQSGANGTMQGDASVKVNYNSSIEAGKVPTINAKTGYVFIGWSDGTSVYAADAVQNYVVTGNVTFTARYENTSKAIAIFDYNGGKDADGKSSITMTGIAGEEITVKAPTREGYTFAGWDKTDLKYGVAGSVTVFTAQWTANKHEVTFVVGDDTKGEMAGEASVQVDHNGSVEANKVPTITAKTGYVFIGWSNGTSTYAAEAIKNYKVTADVTFTAQYEANSKAVVIFDFNGGKDADNKNSISMSGDANAAIDNMDAPTRDGYAFAGWKKGEQDVTDLVFGAAGSVTVYTAQWTVNKHTVTFNAGNNGSMTGNDSVEVEHNGSVAADKVPTITANEGFVFVGWSDGTSVFAKEAIKNYKVTANVTFTAQYEEVASKAFAIFDYAGGKDNNGKSSIMMTGTAGAAITITDPTRAGYTFAGWKNGEATSQNPTFGAAGSVTTYTAVWTADPDKTFKVNFVVDATKGDVTGTTEFDVVSGSFLTEVPTVNAKDGYTFIGWSDGKNTYFTSGVKLYAITGKTTFTALFEKTDNNNPNPPAKDTLTITSNSDTVIPGNQVQFKALLNGTETNDVTWAVKGGTAGTAGTTISESGVLTVGSNEANGTKLTITATSKTDTGLTAEKTIIVTAMPVQKPDGSVVIPGGDGKIDPDNDKKDDITIKPNPKPDGGDGGATVNPDGSVTLPDGGTVTRPNPDGSGKDETIKVPGGSTVDPDGTIHFKYTVTHKNSDGTVIRTESKNVKEGVNYTFMADNISGYTAKPSSVTIKGGDGNYNIVITYTKNNSGGGSSGGGSGSGSSTTKPSKPDTKPTPGTKPNDPTQTGIAKWLRTDKHTTSMTGYGNGLFGPEDKVTRAQVAQIFYRLLKDNNVKITVNFTDVPDDAWYATAVNTLGSLGIVGGIGDGRFDPNRPITRAEFCVIATRFAKVASTVENPFSDINAQDWYYTAVTTAASYDWVTGMGDGTFRPYDVITRAQAATIINRMLGAAADRAFVDKYVPNPYKDVSTTHWAYYQIIEASVAHDHGYDAEGVEIWNSLK